MWLKWESFVPTYSYHFMSTHPVLSILQGVDYREVADFAGVAYHVLQNRTRKDEHEVGMNVHDINNFLNALAEANIVGGEERKGTPCDFVFDIHAWPLFCMILEQTSQAFRALFRRMECLEWKWLIRIILKDLKWGIGEDAILNIFHPDAKDLYDVTSSLSGVCCCLVSSLLANRTNLKCF